MAYNWNDTRAIAQTRAIDGALGEVASSGTLIMAAQSGALATDGEAITNVKYNSDGFLVIPDDDSAWLPGMAVGSRPVAGGF